MRWRERVESGKGLALDLEHLGPAFLNVDCRMNGVFEPGDDLDARRRAADSCPAMRLKSPAMGDRACAALRGRARSPDKHLPPPRAKHVA